jgi:hypothetical protein
MPAQEVILRLHADGTPKASRWIEAWWGYVPGMSPSWHGLAVYFGLSDDDADRSVRRHRRREARSELRSPVWWLVLLTVGIVLGATYEAVAAALGDGRLDLNAVPRTALPAIAAPLVVRVIATSRAE